MLPQNHIALISQSITGVIYLSLATVHPYIVKRDATTDKTTSNVRDWELFPKVFVLGSKRVLLYNI